MNNVDAFEEEMQHELMGAERPGIRSRFQHDLAAFQNTRIQLEVRDSHQAHTSHSESTNCHGVFSVLLNIIIQGPVKTCLHAYQAAHHQRTSHHGLLSNMLSVLTQGLLWRVLACI